MVSFAVVDSRRGGSIWKSVFGFVLVLPVLFTIEASPPYPEHDVEHDQEEERKDGEKADASLCEELAKL